MHQLGQIVHDWLPVTELPGSEDYKVRLSSMRPFIGQLKAPTSNSKTKSIFPQKFFLTFEHPSSSLRQCQIQVL